MNYKTKELLRELAHKYKFFHSIYNYASNIKTIRNNRLDDETFFKSRYKENTGKELDLEKPTTFNEKLIWLQIHDHNPLYTILSDKYLVKDFVSKVIGKEYVIPLIGVWDDVEDIPFNSLPDEYVLKCNHDCGSIFIKRSGCVVNIEKVKKQFKAALKKNYYDVGRVWGYKNIKPKVFCEELIKTEDEKLPRDYKIFCFDGEPKFGFVASDRGENTKFDFYDIDWNRIPVRQHYPNSNYDIQKPKQWEEMLNCAKLLSKGIPQVRVDFYINASEQVLFGEMTFCHFSGKERFEPDTYDYIFGEYININ